MKKLIVCLALVFASCHVPKPLTKNQVIVLITDGIFGVDYACETEWLDGPACVVVYHILNDAIAAVEGLQNGGWQSAAKAVLIREEAPLPADAKIRPYLDAVISLL